MTPSDHRTIWPHRIDGERSSTGERSTSNGERSTSNGERSSASDLVFIGERLDTRRVVTMLSTYPPTQCGLATFAAATRGALALARPDWDVEIVRVCPRGETTHAPEVVTAWHPADDDSMIKAARTIASSSCLVLQHEYGIFGGPDGGDVIDLLALPTIERVPVVAVLHTVLTHPSLGQRRVIAELGRRAACLVVMSDAARDRLLGHYPVSAAKVLVIPHGAHPVPYRAPLVQARRPVLLTWGLVGPGKGLERAIDAVAALRRDGIDVEYRIVGETHPKVREREGERYRDCLEQRARASDVADLVRFDASYRSVADLVPVIEDADVVVIPYDSTEQVTSGVLAEALAAGKAVVATAFPHAVEALGCGAGVVVPHADARAMAAAIASIVTSPSRAQRMSAIARREGARMLWPAVGASLATLVESVTVNACRSPKRVLDLLPVDERVEAS